MLNYIITYGLMVFYYSLFFIAVMEGVKSGSGQLKDVLSGKGEAGVLLSRLIAGIFFLGIGAAVLFEKRNLDTGIISLDWEENWTAVWILMATAIIIGTLTASKKINHIHNSMFFLPLHLPLSFIFIRTLFLIVYEFFFRGVVLFIMKEDMGLLAAILLNLILYAGVHWFDKQQRYGSLIMGIVLCGFSINYGSVWPAIFIHLSLALSHEITLLVKNKSLIKKSWL